MDNTKFKKLLFETACCAVACDYHIDDREIRELEHIESSTVYFKDIDLSRQLEIFLARFKDNEAETIGKVIDSIKADSFSPVEELLILEIVLRLIQADAKIEKQEIKYIKSIRSVLSITDKMITDRFGTIDFLVDESTIQESKVTKTDFASTGLDDIDDMYFDPQDKGKTNK